MKIGEERNEFNTKTSVHICECCGGRFTVCPSVENEGWENCLGPECSSYDPARDADKFFGDPDVEIVKMPIC